MQELENNILNVCQRQLNGLPISPEEKKAIENFMKLNDNATLILRAAHRNPIILVYFRQITKQGRRTGEYYISKQNLFEPTEMIVSMLQQLISFPDLPQYGSIHYLNTYLSLIGEILGKYLFLTDDNMILKSFFTKFMEQQVDIKIKTHSLLKLIGACLQQIIIQRNQYTELCQRRNKVLFFAQKHGRCFIQMVSILFSYICQNFTESCQKWQIYQSMLSLVEIFLEAMNQKGSYHKSVKCYIAEWQTQHLFIWARNICFILINVLNRLWRVNQIIGQEELKLIKMVGTHSVFILSSINQMKSINKQESFQKIRCEIINQFLIPYFNNFSNDVINVTNLNTDFYICQEYNALIIHFLLSGSKTLLQEFIKASEIDQYQINKTKSIESLLNYCEFCVKNSRLSFESFQKCAIGLSIKLIHKLKIIAYGIVQQKMKEQQQKMVEGQDILQLNQKILKKIQQDLQIKHHQFVQKIITRKLFEINTTQTPVYESGKDWEQFFTSQLNQYFMEAAQYFPGYLTDSTIYSQLDYQSKKKEFNQEQMSNQQIYTRKVYLNQLLESFLTQPGFKLIYYVFCYISEQIHKHILNNQQKNPDQQTNFFSRLIPLLSLLRAIIFRGTDSQKKGFLYYQFYKISLDLKIDLFTQQNQFKVKLCKLYILKAFIQQCIPNNFDQRGQNASCTLVYLFNHQIISHQELIRDSIKIITDCLIKADHEIEFQEEIVNFSLNILQYIVKKMTERINFLLDENLIDSFMTIKPYKQTLKNLKWFLIDLNLNSPSSVRKIYSICASITQVFDTKFFYDVIQNILFQIKINKLGNQQKFENLDVFLSGVTGFLQSLTKTQKFKIAVQLFLHDEELLNDILEDKGMIQCLLPFLVAILSEKLSDLANNSVQVKFIEIFRPYLQDLMKKWLIQPNLLPEAIQLYKRVAKIKYTEFILPLCQNYCFDNQTDLLDLYFQQIHRVQHIDKLYKYAILKVQWINSFVQAKLLRGQTFTVNLQVLAPNIKFAKQKNVQTLIQNLSVAMGRSKKQISERIQNLFDQIDCILYQPRVKDTDSQINQ